jgi:hypothetical protein
LPLQFGEPPRAIPTPLFVFASADLGRLDLTGRTATPDLMNSRLIGPWPPTPRPAAVGE